MSGISLAVAPRSEPEETITTNNHQKALQHGQQRSQVAMGGIMGPLRVVELQLVAFIMVFSASGLIPLVDLIFPVLTTVYFAALSRLAFPSHGITARSLEIFQRSGFFRMYVVVGTTIGLFLPLAYVLGGFARGDDHALRSAAPHLFLLACQILTENVISGLSLFSPPVRALVPLLYTIRRLFVIIDWIHDAWINKALPANAPFKYIGWYWFGRALAVANLVYFSINLFGFLIPQFLPKAFEMYFRQRDEIHAKTVEDKHSAAADNSRVTDAKSDKSQVTDKKSDKSQVADKKSD